MRTLFTVSASLGLLLAATTAAAAEPTVLEERMSGEDFKAAGLDLLSPDQLRHLNQWLSTNGIRASVAPIKRRDGSMVFYPDETDREAVESTIQGTFAGWRGQTVVTLANGQKWQQSESGARADVRMTNPAVTVKPMLMGSWLMVVKGCSNCSIRVKRVN